LVAAGQLRATVNCAGVAVKDDSAPGGVSVRTLNCEPMGVRASDQNDCTTPTSMPALVGFQLMAGFSADALPRLELAVW